MVNGLAKPWEGGSTKWMEECRLDSLNIACAQYSKKDQQTPGGVQQWPMSGHCSSNYSTCLFNFIYSYYKLPDGKLKYRMVHFYYF